MRTRPMRAMTPFRPQDEQRILRAIDQSSVPRSKARRSIRPADWEAFAPLPELGQS